MVRNTLNTQKIVLILSAIFMLALISGCGNNSTRCSDGANCIYYQGTQGVYTRLENNPRIFYFHTADLGKVDGNEMEFDVRLENKGASYAYGATYLEGFDPNLFSLWKMGENGQWEQINVPRENYNNCYFDLLGLGTSVNSVAFTGGCYGIDGYRTNNANWGANLDLKQFCSTVLNKDCPDMNLGFSEVGENNFMMQFGYDNNLINALTHGATLLSIVYSNLNFERFGGDVFALEGDNEDYPGGGIAFSTFKAKMEKPWPVGQDFITIPYNIKSCYAYTTYVSPMICVDPNPYSADKKICTSEQYTWGGSQGAPVAVTRMEQTNTGKEVVLHFTIKNVGGGTVWDVGYLESCSPYFPGNVRNNMHNVVYVGQAWIGDYPIDCSRQYKVRLDPNTRQGEFTCIYDYQNAGAGNVGGGYLTPLKMELWYGYEEVLRNQITVRKLG